MGRVREEKRRRKKIKKRKPPKKEDPGARKGRKVAKHCVFPMICGSGGSKSRLAKAAGAEPCGQMRDEKLHAVVARSTFRSQNVQNTSAPEHFYKLRCTTFGRSDVVLRGRCKGLCTLSKVSRTRGFCSISKNDGRRGTFEDDLQRCIFRGRRTIRDMFIKDVRR